jgi:putative ABC transport system permease protein
MKVLKLIIKNVFRHKLRSLLTIVGIAVAVMAFGLLRTLVTSWYAGSAASAPDRLITRQAVSFIFSLPLADKEQIARVPGVKAVTHESWFGGIYVDKNQFFARIAVEAETFFDLYPEFIVPPDQLETFKKERNSCVIGRKLAEQYHLKIGDIMQLAGDIYPGDWQFVIRGIYKGKEKINDESQMFFHWDYLNEHLLKTQPTRANVVGWYALKIANPSDAANVTQKIDEIFANSPAPTKTETEKEFAAGFISMSSAILTSLEVISYVIIGIIFLVLANTMIMTARERIREYAVLKTLGFTSQHLIVLIFGESLSIAILGGILGLVLTFPACAGFAIAMQKFLPIFIIEPATIIIAGSFAILVGIISAIFPAIRAVNIKIVDGLRQIG